MTKSELIEIIAKEQSHLAYRDVELAVKCMIEHMSQSWHRVRELRFADLGAFHSTTAAKDGTQPKNG